MWTAPIIDRTLVDVTTLTTKGKLSANDLNRIEGNIEILSTLLNNFGYGATLTSKTDWAITDFPYQAQMARLISNATALVTAYHSQGVTLPADLELALWNEMNDLENVLKLMNDMISLMQYSFRYCGTFACGQTPLPQFLMVQFFTTDNEEFITADTLNFLVR